MLHKYCLQNRNIFYSINSRLQLPFFFFFNLYQGLTVLTYINKKSFFFKKIAISYSNLTLLLNFFMKKKLLPRKTLSTKNRTTLPVHLRWFLYYYLYYYLSISILLSILLFKGLFLFGFLIFQFENTPTPLYLCRDKIKGQFGKNATLTSTKTLPKKQDKFPVNFQIFLSIHKLYCQNKNYI